MRRRKRMMEDLDRDIREHIEMETQDNIERGMSPEEARRRAFVKFGNVTRVKEETREVWSFVWLEQVLQDICFGVRMLRKAPGFTTVAVLTLALGIGANTAIFSAVNGIVLEPYLYAQSSRLVNVALLSVPEIHAIQQQSTVFERTAIYQGHGTLISDVAVPEQVTSSMVRTSTDPMAMFPAMERVVRSVDNDAPITNIETVDQIIANSAAEPRFQTALLGSFGALGLLLAIIGTYGVISYSVVQRTHEIGVRMALGAEPLDVMRLVVGQGARLALIGIVLGVAGALALTRFLQSMLFEIKPTDPVTFVGVAILLTVVTLAACWIPARRAMRVDLMVALRYE